MQKLEAINQLRVAAQMSGINSLSGTLAQETLDAITILDKVSKEVLSEGYDINTSKEYKLVPDINGIITLPDSVIDLQINNPYSKEYVIRNGKLYNLTDETYTITRTNLEATIIFDIDFEYLPYPIANYIVKRAITEFVDQQLADNDLTQKAQIREAMAYRTFKKSITFRKNPNMLNYIASRRSIL